MFIKTIRKILNRTESGNTGTNDTYISIISNMRDFFSTEELNTILSFKDLKTGQFHEFKPTTPGSEIRLTKIGSYLRQNNSTPGDEIVLQKKLESKTIDGEIKESAEFYIDILNYSNRIVLDCVNKDKLHFISKFNQERLENILNGNSEIEIQLKNSNENIYIKDLKESKKIRTQSYKKYSIKNIDIIFDNFNKSKFDSIIIQKNEGDEYYEIVHSCNWQYHRIES